MPFTVYWQITVNEPAKMGAIHGFFRINTLIADEKAGLVILYVALRSLGNKRSRFTSATLFSAPNSANLGSSLQQRPDDREARDLLVQST